VNHGSLFSGIGGFDLAAQWCGWQNIFQVEINNFCQKVLIKNFPAVKRYKDIKEFDGTEYRGAIDIISGGFPCQPFSVAGKRKGTEDDRSLWHEMFRIIKEIKPHWIVGENVAGIVNMELNNVLADLEGEGYETQTFIIPACAVGAPHRRDRVWIVANNEKQFNWQDLSKSNKRQVQEFRNCVEQANICYSVSESRWQEPKTGMGMERNVLQGQEWQENSNRVETPGNDVANSESKRLERSNATGNTCTNGRNLQYTRNNWWSTEPDVGRVAHGIPRRVDRLKSLGNAIVPQVAFEIFKRIDQLCQIESKNTAPGD